MTQVPLFAPDSAWRPTLPSALPSWAGAKRVAIDLETKDEQLEELGPGVRRGGYVVGYSFAIEDGPAHYVPFRHEDGRDNVDSVQALAYLSEQAAHFDGIIVGANLQYELDYLTEAGITFPKVQWFRDVQVAEPLIDELQMSYSLENVAQRRGLTGKYEDVLKAAAETFDLDPKKEMWKLPARYVGEYAIQDVRLPLQLLRKQERDIEEQELWPIFDLESRVLPALVRMRRRGVKIDLDALDKVERWTAAKEAQVLSEVRRLTGVDIPIGEVWTTELLAKALRKIGVEPPLTPKTKKPSIKQDFLRTIDHDVARHIVRARQVNKVRTTFAASMREYMTNGRVHCSFNQLRSTKDDDSDDQRGARYGRLSSSDPNLQQQPARDPEIGPMWRAIFVPDTDIWACCDISQQEPRWTTHYAARLDLPGAAEAAERYRSDPRLDNHDMMAQLIAGQGPDWKPDKKTRDAAKIIFLGLCYGMGGGKLCRGLGLPTQWIQSKRTGGMVEIAGPEGKAILDNFDARVPFVRKLAYKASDRAKAVGYVITAGGRRCRFPLAKDGSYDWAHKALNRIIQGSSADQMKKALVDADAAGFALQLQVHDELDMSVQSPTEAHELARIMREAIPALVPFKVDVEIGPNWGNLTSHNLVLDCPSQ